MNTQDSLMYKACKNSLWLFKNTTDVYLEQFRAKFIHLQEYCLLLKDLVQNGRQDSCVFYF